VLHLLGSNNEFNDEALRIISENFKGLRELVLQGANTFTLEGLEALTSSLAHLEVLHLLGSNNEFNDEALITISKSLKGLRELELEGANTFTSEGLNALTHSLIHLVLLHLCGLNEFDNEAFIKIGKNLKSLRSLMLSGANVTPEGLIGILNLLNLKELIVYIHNDFDFTEALKDMKEEAKKLEVLRLSGPCMEFEEGTLKRVTEVFPSLQDLSLKALSMGYFNQDDIKALRDNLTKLRRLEIVALGFCGRDIIKGFLGDVELEIIGPMHKFVKKRGGPLITSQENHIVD
jgi:hypothetical protein